MFCSACGKQIRDDAHFCAECGAPVAQHGTSVPETHPIVPPPTEPLPQPTHTAPSPQPPSSPREPYSPAPPPGRGSYGVPPVSPGKKNRTGLWIGIAAAAVIIIAAAIIVPLVALGDDDESTETTEPAQTTSTSIVETTSTTPASSESSTTSSASTTVPTPGSPGDSSGDWAEVEIPGIPAGSLVASVSEQAMLIESDPDNQRALYAYLFDSGTIVELPIEAQEFYGADLDGLLAVWWEGTYDQPAGEYSDEHIYAFRLPDGPKVEVAGAGRAMSYSQVAGGWITWVEGDPWVENPDEYYLLKIFGVQVDSNGRPLGDPIELVSSATAFALGDAVWTYSLSDAHLAWEQAASVDLFEPGTYIMDLASRQPLVVGQEAWRPSVASGQVAYYENGLKVADISTGNVREIDPSGDFPAAAPSYAAYFRSVQTGDESAWEIVARGYDGNHEQVLGRQYYPPWLSPLIGVSGNRVAFTADGVTHLFEWQSR